MSIADFHNFAHNHHWEALIVMAVLLFILDFFGHRLKDGHEHAVNMKEAILWSIFWVGAGILFGGFVWFAEGRDSMSRYFTSFVMEKGMSVDNIAVWLAILTGMAVPKDKWHELLTWGIVGAIIFRGIFIFGGMSLIHRFSWLEIVLGISLILGAIKILGLKISLRPFSISISDEHEEIDMEKNHVIRATKAIFSKLNIPLKTSGAVFMFTLITIEITDIIFALDSVPVVIALNDSMFVAVSSNLFAIFGLRALFFVVAEFLSSLEYLKFGLSATLFFIACKMIFSFDIAPLVSLAVVLSIIMISVVASLVKKKKK